MSREDLKDFWRKPLYLIVKNLEQFGAKHFAAIIGATPDIVDRFRPFNQNVLNINNYPLVREIKSEFIPSRLKERAICYLGNMSEERGIIPLIESLAYHDIKLHIVGNIYPPELKENLKKLAGWQNVIDNGYLNRDDAQKVIRKCRLSVLTFLPTPHHLTCQPAKLYEYLANGLPVIASNIEHWESIILDKKVGVTVDPSNSKAIAEVTLKLIDDKNTCDHYSRNAIELIETKVNWDVESKKLLKLYSSIKSHT